MQANAGIIDQDIDTSESNDGLRDLRLALGGICDVLFEGERCAAGCFDITGGLLRFCQVEIAAQD